MQDESFAYSPADEREIVNAHNARLEEESQLERDRRVSGSYADSQARLARAMNLLTARVKPHMEEK